jgi:cyclic pyranopterin monophosphate synthase
LASNPIDKPGGEEPSSKSPQNHGLSHLNAQGEARMVDVSAKQTTTRTATAQAVIRLQPSTLEAAINASGPKGEVFGTARVAGIMAAKRTPEAIPMCHPISISGVDVSFETDLPPDDQGRAGVRVQARVRCAGQTGVEMEALHAASVAALTVYDMLKALEKGIEIESIRLLEKTGGKSDYKPGNSQ